MSESAGISFEVNPESGQQLVDLCVRAVELKLQKKRVESQIYIRRGSRPDIWQRAISREVADIDPTSSRFRERALEIGTVALTQAQHEIDRYIAFEETVGLYDETKNELDSLAQALIKEQARLTVIRLPDAFADGVIDYNIAGAGGNVHDHYSREASGWLSSVDEGLWFMDVTPIKSPNLPYYKIRPVGIHSSTDPDSARETVTPRVSVSVEVPTSRIVFP